MLLDGTAINFSRSLIRLAWMLQHVETLLPMSKEFDGSDREEGYLDCFGVTLSVYTGRRELVFILGCAR